MENNNNLLARCQSTKKTTPLILRRISTTTKPSIKYTPIWKILKPTGPEHNGGYNTTLIKNQYPD